jgi:hypothetical protein
MNTADPQVTTGTAATFPTASAPEVVAGRDEDAGFSEVEEGGRRRGGEEEAAAAEEVVVVHHLGALTD